MQFNVAALEEKEKRNEASFYPNPDCRSNVGND